MTANEREARIAARGWSHPLSQAVRVLIARIQFLERTLPLDDAGRAAWPHWEAYTLACNTVARLIAITTEPAERIARGELTSRFGKREGAR